jgi:hypothetical protein
MTNRHDYTGQRVICFTHANCFDGAAAAWVVKKFIPHAEVFPMQYGHEVPVDVTDARVYVVDFIFPPEMMFYLMGRAKHLTLLDHHEKARTFVRDTMAYLKDDRVFAASYREIVDEVTGDVCNSATFINKLEESKQVAHLEHSETQSGALMTWNHFSSERPPEIISHVSDYDRWDFELPGTEAIIAGLDRYAIDVDEYTILFKDPDLCILLEAVGKEILAYRDTVISEIIKQTLRTITLRNAKGDVYTVPLINCPKIFISKALERLAKGAPFAVGYYDTVKERIYSLRSTKGVGVNVHEIAMHYSEGGGGHEHAAGFPMARDTPLARY